MRLQTIVLAKSKQTIFKKEDDMTDQDAIKAIKDNWPTERYTILREALTIAIERIQNNPLSFDAVLAEVRALQEEAKIMSEVHPSKDARFFAGCVYKFLSEHFS